MRLFPPILLVAAALALASCAPNNTLNRNAAKYSLGPISTPVQTVKRDVRPLVIAPVNVLSPYDDLGIVYSADRTPPTITENAMWSEPLSVQVRRQLAAYIAAAGVFGSVSEGDNPRPGELVLNTTILRAERLLSVSQQPAVSVSVSYSLYNPSSDIVLLTATYTETLPVRSRYLNTSIDGFTTAFENTYQRLVHDLATRR